MTKYTVVVEDKQYKIDLTKTESQEHFTVKIDDKPHKLELENKLEYNKPLKITLDQKTFTVQIAKNQKNTSFQVKIEDLPLIAEVKTQQFSSLPQAITAPAPMHSKPKTSASRTIVEGAVNAPMAGKIVSIKAKKGDAVKANTVICILEAMKMENEILAQKDGLVKEIFVSSGTGVNKGDPIFIIDASEN